MSDEQPFLRACDFPSEYALLDPVARVEIEYERRAAEQRIERLEEEQRRRWRNFLENIAVILTSAAFLVAYAFFMGWVSRVL